jgi:hypothetical protein
VSLQPCPANPVCRVPNTGTTRCDYGSKFCVLSNYVLWLQEYISIVSRKRMSRPHCNGRTGPKLGEKTFLGRLREITPRSSLKGALRLGPIAQHSTNVDFRGFTLSLRWHPSGTRRSSQLSLRTPAASARSRHCSTHHGGQSSRRSGKPFHIDVEHRRHVERQDLRHDQAANHRNT